MPQTLKNKPLINDKGLLQYYVPPFPPSTLRYALIMIKCDCSSDGVISKGIDRSSIGDPLCTNKN